MKELGSQVAQQPEAQAQQSKLNPSQDHDDRSEQPVVGCDPQGPRQVEEKRPVLRRSKHVLFMKKLLNMIEREHLLSAVTQVTSQITSNQC